MQTPVDEARAAPTPFFGLRTWEAGLCLAAGLCCGLALLAGGKALLGLAAVPVATALALITLVDQRFYRIPNALSLPLVPLGLAVSLIADPPQFWESAFGAIMGGGLFLLVRWFYRRFRRIDGLGLGDVKLMAAGGALAGLQGLAPVVLIACLAAFATLLARRLLLPGDGGHAGLRTRIPFGAYLSPAILAVWLYQALS